MQALPRVTHGKDLCKTCLQSPMGRKYASPDLHKTLTRQRRSRIHFVACHLNTLTELSHICLWRFIMQEHPHYYL